MQITTFASEAASPKPKYNPHITPNPVLRTARRGRAAEPHDLLEKGKAVLGASKRGLVRKMLARHGPDLVRRALDAVERKHPAEPAAYFAACCEDAKLAGAANGHDPPELTGPDGPPPPEMLRQAQEFLRQVEEEG